MMPKNTKQELLDFAELAARQRGYNGFSYADLADVAGIRKASIHYHFPTKADLSVALMKRYHKRLDAACSEIDISFETGSAKLKELISHYHIASDNGKMLCLCVSFTSCKDSLSEDTNRHLNKFREMILNWIETYLTQGKKDNSITDIRDARNEAYAILALLEGAHMAARAFNDISVFTQATSVLLSRCK